MPGVNVKFDVTFQASEDGRNAPQYTLDTNLGGELTLESLFRFMKQALITTARVVLDEELASGFDKNYRTVVDNRYNKSINDVHPLGKIDFVARQDMKEIILDTYNAILERSPVGSGTYYSHHAPGLYKKSHFVYYNGSLVATDLPGLASWVESFKDFKERDYIRFVNVQPYARKLERLGVTAGNGKFNSASVRTQKSRDSRGRSGTHILAPNGAYFLASRAIRRKYKRNSVIAFKFISGSGEFLNVPGQFKTGAGGARKTGTRLNYHGRGGKRVTGGRHYLYPSITISVDSKGITGGDE